MAENDFGNMPVEAILAGTPIADSIKAIEPSLMPELAPHLINEVLLSLRTGHHSLEELNFVAKALVTGLNDVDELRAAARMRQSMESSVTRADLDDY